MLYHYTTKALQLYFICSWQEAKMHKTSFEKLRTFQRLRYVLAPRTYFVGLAVVAALFSIPIIYAVSARQIYSNAAATNGYQTLRCEWWNLPGTNTMQQMPKPLFLPGIVCANLADHYTEPKSKHLLCPCIRLQTPLGVSPHFPYPSLPWMFSIHRLSIYRRVRSEEHTSELK